MVFEQPKPKLKMSLPSQPLTVMILISLAVGVGAAMLWPRLLPVFETNPYLNGLIAFVFLVGVLICYFQVFAVMAAARWLNWSDMSNVNEQFAPRLMRPLASMLRERREGMLISNTAARAILDSVASRVEDGRDISRYIVNLLIFLGLLGTFYGLATTVPALVDTIKSLNPEDGESGLETFSRLIGGLENQLAGMGVAFASSLLGLAGSLVVGLLEIFASHGQNRFYRELEEWMSTITRVSYSDQDAEGANGALIVADILDQMHGQMQEISAIFNREAQERAKLDGKMGQLVDMLSAVMKRLETSAASTHSIEDLTAAQNNLAQSISGLDLSEGFDGESRMRLRSIDIQLLRVLEEIAAGRQEAQAELRHDIRAVISAIKREDG